MSETLDLNPVAEPVDVTVDPTPRKADVVVGAAPTQQIVLVEVLASQGIPGSPGSIIPPVAGVADLQKVVIARDLGGGPVWTKDFAREADIDPASATLDFRPRNLSATELHFGSIDTSGLREVAGGGGELAFGPFGLGNRIVSESSGAGRLRYYQGGSAAVLDIVGRTALEVGPSNAVGFHQDADAVIAANKYGQVTLDKNSGGTGTGWRLQWSTGLLSWMVAGVAKLTIAADGAVSFLKGLFTGTVVINTTGGAVPAPIDAATLISASSVVQARIELNGLAGGPPIFMGRAARGTGPAPAAIKTFDQLVVLQGRGYGATAWASSGRAAITFTASEDWTDTAQGAQINFQTTTNGLVGVANRWQFTHDGQFVPALNNTYDVGSATLATRSGYFGTFVAVNSVGPAGPPIVDAATQFQLTRNGPVRAELNGFAGPGVILGRRANGTAAAPSALKAADSLISISATGYGAAAWAVGNRGVLLFQAAQDWTDAAQGCNLVIQTTPNGSTALANRWQFTHDGHLSPMVPSVSDLGAPTLPLRSGYFGAPVSINMGPTPAPAPSDPNSALQITGNSATQAQIELTAFNGTTALAARSAGGTAAAPLPLGAGAYLFGLNGAGYTPGGFVGAKAQFSMRTAQAWTNAATGTDIVFGTTPNGSIALRDIWKFSEGGHLLPMVDAVSNIGAPASRVGNLYASQAFLTGGLDALAVALHTYGNFATFVGFSANGTAAAPTPSTSGQPLAAFQGIGRAPSGWGTAGAAFVVVASETYTDAAQGTHAYISTTPIGTKAIAVRWYFTNDGQFLPAANKTYDVGGGANLVRNVYADNIILGNNLGAFTHLGGANDAVLLKMNNVGNDYFMADALTRDLTWNINSAPKFVIRQSGQVETFGKLIVNGDETVSGLINVGTTSKMLLRANDADNNSVVAMHNPSGSYWIYDWAGTQLTWVQNSAAKFWVTGAGDASALRDVVATRDLRAARDVVLAGFGYNDTPELRGRYWARPAPAASFTLALSDQGAFIVVNAAAAAVVTIPPQATVAWPSWVRLDVLWYGAGQVSFVGGAGVTIRSAGGKLKIANRYSAVSLAQINPDEWLLVGDLAA